MPPPKQTIRFCTSEDGTRLAYAESGNGPPLISSSTAVWRHWLNELSRGHGLVQYNERGCGLSDWNVDDLSFEAWLRDLELVVDACGLERFPLLVTS
jgi:pimeloyl-ACP methyl ester carboxylesterase